MGPDKWNMDVLIANANEVHTERADLIRRWKLSRHYWRIHLDQAALINPRGQRGDAVVKANLFRNLAVDYFQHSRTGEVHLAASRSRQGADQEVPEGRTRVRAATFPLTDDVIALGDQVGSAPEIEIRECSAEIGHERLNVGAAATGVMQRVFEQHVRRGDLVDNAEIDGLAPE